MNVGIITVHDSANLGSYLQALGMQEVVRNNGDTPFIIESRSHLTTLALFLGYNRAKPVRSVSRFLRFFKKAITNPIDIKVRYRKYQIYKRDWTKFDTVVSIKRANKIGMDAIILGSDEIWNVNQPAFQNPILYGDGVSANRKVAYAISCGTATANQIHSFPALEAAIRRLDAIAIRDNFTAEQLAALNIPITARVCDPTIQADIRRYMSLSSDIIENHIPYIAIYAYSLSSETIEEIKRFAKSRGLKTVAVSLQQDWCDSYVNCSPLEFGAVLKGASYVYTATFHGTIFSALYHTNFVVDAKLQKVNDVLQLLDLTDRIIKEPITEKSLSAFFSAEIDYSSFEERLISLREDSAKWYRYCVHGEN